MGRVIVGRNDCMRDDCGVIGVETKVWGRREMS